MRGLFSIHALTGGIAAWPWAEAAVTVFGFAWGAMFGSFINVVVHRLPLGESLSRHRSRCPRCGAAIRATDNVPVLGWLRLGGRCRDCGAVIAARYPLVEAGCGTIGMLLAWAELAAGGRWLPRGDGGFPQGIDRLLRGDWSLLLACLVHVAVAVGIVTWSLLDLAGWKPKRSWAWVPILAATTIVSLVPAIGPGGVLPGGGDWPATPPSVQALVASLAGIAWGGLLGRAATSSGIRLGLPLLGSVLGWQAVTVVAAVTALGWRTVAAWRAVPSAAAGLFLAAAGTLGLAFQQPIHAGVTAALAVILPDGSPSSGATPAGALGHEPGFIPFSWKSGWAALRWGASVPHGQISCRSPHRFCRRVPGDQPLPRRLLPCRLRPPRRRTTRVWSRA
jgi:prepilin signal peptidase PulO-like enzyme (type II secretory pathway)